MLNMLQVLEIQREGAGWIMDAIRSIFWFLAKAVLILVDGVYLHIKDIWRFKFFDNEYVNNLFSAAIIVACTWLVLKVVLEFLMHHIINHDEHSSPLAVYKGIIIAITMMFLIPHLFTFGYNVSSKLTDYVIASSTSESSSVESSMVTMILSATANNDKMSEEDKNAFINNWFFEDINATVNGGLLDAGDYKYSFNLFMIIIISLISVFLLFFIAIQVATRIIELALYKVIAPFVCTSLINNRSRAFEVWCKSVMGTFLVTTVQFLCLGILFNVFGSVISGTSYPLSVILILIGSLLFIISSPSLVSSLLNTNTGAMSSFGQLHSLVAMGTSMVALSKYGKVNNSNTNNTTSNDNSSNNSGGSGAEATNTNNTSSLGSINSSNNSNSNNDNNSSNNNSSSDPNNLPHIDSGNSNYSNDLAGMNNTTSLDDRINVYKDMTDTHYSLNQNSSFNYNTTVDWGLNNVSNTKEYKS